MVKKISGRLKNAFFSRFPKKIALVKVNLKLSLLGALMGIFLLPNLAYLSTITPEKLIELTNQERLAAGLSSLTANQLLTQAAARKGQAILETNLFGHTINDRKFSAWIRDTGYNYSYVGENLAIDFASSEGVMEAWNNSPLHKKNLLSPYYKEIGISAVPGKFQGQDTIVVVQIFGAPAISSAIPGAQASESEFLNLNPIPAEINLFNPRLIDPENLLTHAIINQEILPLDNKKLALPPNTQANTFIVQPNYELNLNYIFIIFSFLLPICFLIFLYTYYFTKIKRLISILSSMPK